MEHTPKLGLKKPGLTDYVNIGDLNDNMDVIDDAFNATDQGVEKHITDPTAHGIGDKKTLLTTNKGSIVGALNELFKNANDGKKAVASAITAKGVSASPDDTFGTLATKIGQISTGLKVLQGTITTNGASFRVSELDFRPDIIYVDMPDNRMMKYFNPNKYPNLKTNNNLAIYTPSSDKLMNYLDSNFTNLQIYEDGFQVRMTSSPNTTVHWIAMGE